MEKHLKALESNEGLALKDSEGTSYQAFYRYSKLQDSNVLIVHAPGGPVEVRPMDEKELRTWLKNAA